MNQTLVKTYGGNQPKAAGKFQKDANEMGQLGYHPVSQSYQDSRWGFFGILFMAGAIFFGVVGLFAPAAGSQMVIWFLALVAFGLAFVFRRNGALTVTYGYKETAQ